MRTKRIQRRRRAEALAENVQQCYEDLSKVERLLRRLRDRIAHQERAVALRTADLKKAIAEALAELPARHEARRQMEGLRDYYGVTTADLGAREYGP